MNPHSSPPQQSVQPFYNNKLLKVDVCIECAEWTKHFSKRTLNLLTNEVLRAVFTYVEKTKQRQSICVIFIDNAYLHTLNKTYRGQDKPTNVLSFFNGAETKTTLLLGDIFLSSAYCIEEATAQQKTLKQHLTHLLVHGGLHLLGYDHEIEDDAAEMESLEIAILATLNISNPYAPL